MRLPRTSLRFLQQHGPGQVWPRTQRKKRKHLKRTKMGLKELKEHPWLSWKQAEQIAYDHKKKKRRY